MLTLRPHPPPVRPPDMYRSRGRSTKVSRAALARQASEERRATADALRRSLQHAIHSERREREHRDTQRDLFLNTPPQPHPHPPQTPSLSSSASSSSSSSASASASSSPPVSTPDVILPPPALDASPEVIPIAAPAPKKPTESPVFLRSPSASPLPSPSTSPTVNLDYYDSPPSPPRTLEDQLHVAYAHENMLLAKILLLRLKGIEVTGDDDPRIAAVKDEDFDLFFVPYGGLVDERDEASILEQQRIEQENIQERIRMERIRSYGHIWEEQKRRMREQKLLMLRKREAARMAEEERQRQLVERMARDRAPAEPDRAKPRASMRVERRGNARKVVSYGGLLDPKPSVDHDLFMYDFMIPTRSSSATHAPKSSSRPSLPHPRPTIFPNPPVFDDTRSIPFSDVLMSMQGPLFPVQNDQPAPRSVSPSAASLTKRKREAELFQSLVEYVGATEADRRLRKGKQREQQQQQQSHASCAACTSQSPSPPPSIPPSRTNSWLSFRSATTSTSSSSSNWSASTDITTPATSPTSTPPSALSNWFKPAQSFASRLPKSAVTAPSGAPDTSSTPLCRACRSRSRLTPVHPSEFPLPLAGSASTSSISISTGSHLRGRDAGFNSAKDSAGVFVRRIARFVELAKGFQNAYMNAALFSVAASYDSYEDREVNFEVIGGVVNVRQNRGRNNQRKVQNGDGRKIRLRQAGYRVSVEDVSCFLSAAATTDAPLSSSALPDIESSSQSVISDDQPPASVPCYIPLRSPFPSRTILPDQLPYATVFKPVHNPTPSPFTFRALTESPMTRYPRSALQSPALRGGEYDSEGRQMRVTWRERYIGNPVHLRLKAIKNNMWVRGIPWEAFGRNNTLGGGKERVSGVAFEGLGRSLLGIGV